MLVFLFPEDVPHNMLERLASQGPELDRGEPGVISDSLHQSVGVAPPIVK